MGWVPDNVIEALRGSHQLGIFMRVDTDPVLHLWMGVNDIPAGIDSIDPEGTVYLGGGRLQGLPSLEVLINGTSDAVEFSLSGVDPATGQRMLSSIPPVRGAEVQIGLTTLDEYYQPMSAIVPRWTGIASHKSYSSPVVTGSENPTVTIVLTVVAGENTRSRAAKSMWTAAQQKADYPTDRFCDQVARLAAGVQPAWPRYN